MSIFKIIDNIKLKSLQSDKTSVWIQNKRKNFISNIPMNESCNKNSIVFVLKCPEIVSVRANNCYTKNHILHVRYTISKPLNMRCDEPQQRRKKRCSFIESSVVFAILLSSNIFVHTKKRHIKKKIERNQLETLAERAYLPALIVCMWQVRQIPRCCHTMNAGIEEKKQHTTLMLIAINRICCTHNGTSLSVLCIVSGSLLSHRSTRC